MVASVHDARTSDKRSAERRDHDNERPPDFTLSIQNVQLRGEVERKVKQSSERYYHKSALMTRHDKAEHTAAVPRRKALEAVLQDIVVGLGADIDGGERQTHGIDDCVGLDLATARCQLINSNRSL